jgi:hexokinase
MLYTRPWPYFCHAVMSLKVALLVLNALLLDLLFAQYSLGVIFGTGTNGVYFEDVSKFTKAPQLVSKHPNAKMVVNTEWGAFDPTVTF